MHVILQKYLRSSSMGFYLLFWTSNKKVYLQLRSAEPAAAAFQIQATATAGSGAAPSERDALVQPSAAPAVWQA